MFMQENLVKKVSNFLLNNGIEHGQTSAETWPEFTTLEVAMCMPCTHVAIKQNCLS
jgi:hypothetical protein